MAHDPSAFIQEYFRIRSGDTVGLNADSGWAGIENADATIGTGLAFRIRFKVRETAAGNETTGFKLQVNRNSAGWVDVDVLGGASLPAAQAVVSSQFADGDATSTERLTNTTTYVNGEGLEDNTSASYTLTSEETELEWCLMIMSFHDGPTQNVVSDTLDFRVVESDGTVFTGTYVNPTITVSESAGYVGGAFVETPNRLGPFIDTNGNIYTIIEATPSGAEFLIIKSTNGGDTWREMDGANRPLVNDLECVDAVQASDTIYIAHHADSTVEHHTFRMSDHASPDTWGTTDDTVASITGPANQQGTAIERRSDGDLIIFYNRDVSGQEELFYKINTGGGWGSELTLESEALFDWGFVTCVMGESDLIHIFYKGTGSSLGPIYHRSLSSADSLSAREAVDADAGNGSSFNAALTTAIYWDDGGDEKIMIIYSDDADDLLYSVVVTNDGSPAARKTVSDNTVDTSPPSTGSKQPAANLANDDEVAYAHYSSLADLDIYRDLATNDGGWGTDVEEQDAVTCHWIRGSVFTHSVGNGSDKVVGYIWDDGSGGGAGRIWYSEFVIPPSVRRVFITHT